MRPIPFSRVSSDGMCALVSHTKSTIQEALSTPIFVSHIGGELAKTSPGLSARLVRTTLPELIAKSGKPYVVLIGMGDQTVANQQQPVLCPYTQKLLPLYAELSKQATNVLFVIVFGGAGVSDDPGISRVRQSASHALIVQDQKAALTGLLTSPGHGVMPVSGAFTVLEVGMDGKKGKFRLLPPPDGVPVIDSSPKQWAVHSASFDQLAKLGGVIAPSGWCAQFVTERERKTLAAEINSSAPHGCPWAPTRL